MNGASREYVGIIPVYESIFADAVRAADRRRDHIVLSQTQIWLYEITRNESTVALKKERLLTDISATQHSYHFVRLYDESVLFLCLL